VKTRSAGEECVREDERAHRDLEPRQIARSDMGALVARARTLAASGQRHILGITGAPGAGKSTLAEELVAGLAPGAVLVPMDGFHLAEAELMRLGIHERKGAIDTFDAGGYISLIRRLRQQTEQVIYAPAFRRDLEEAIAGAIPIPISAPLVITEGNYLLADAAEWKELAGLLDEVWYLEPDEEGRIERLIRRHVAFGRDRHSAEERALGSDQRNAELIMDTRGRADVIVAGTIGARAPGRGHHS
jgi:pantothenate kinase